MRKSLVAIAATALFILICGPQAVAFAAPTNGSGSEIPAYYDAQIFTIQFVELSPQAEKTQIAMNPSINFIYQSDQAEAAGFNFTSVIDAVPTDGFNPMWQEVQIIFLTIPYQQFFSDDEINAAAAAGQIELIPTTEVYRCPVVATR